MHMIFLRKLQFFIIILCAITVPSQSGATVLEFNQDGTITAYEAVDYLSVVRKNSSFHLHQFSKESTRYDNIIQKISEKHHVNPQLIKAVISVESAYRSNAVSSKGAEGLMQLMPKTAEFLNVQNTFDPEDNINGGAKYLKSLLNKYDHNLELALAAYNAGEGAVDKYGGIPPYRETQHYVEKVKLILSRNDN